MFTTLNVLPAYGRDYKSQAEVQKDWDEDKDFVVQGLGGHGQYVNRHDALTQGISTVLVRYAKMMKVYAVKM